MHQSYPRPRKTKVCWLAWISNSESPDLKPTEHLLEYLTSEKATGAENRKKSSKKDPQIYQKKLQSSSSRMCLFAVYLDLWGMVALFMQQLSMGKRGFMHNLFADHYNKEPIQCFWGHLLNRCRIEWVPLQRRMQIKQHCISSFGDGLETTAGLILYFRPLVSALAWPNPLHWSGNKYVDLKTWSSLKISSNVKPPPPKTKVRTVSWCSEIGWQIFLPTPHRLLWQLHCFWRRHIILTLGFVIKC